MQAKIEAGQYQSNALLELSAPLHLPYTTNWTDWEKLEGDIEIEGVQYRYVERKITEGRIYVRCLPNTARQQVINARDRFAMLAYDVNQPAKSENQVPVYISNYLGDYDDQATINWSFQLILSLHQPMPNLQQMAKNAPVLEGPCMPPEWVY